MGRQIFVREGTNAAQTTASAKLAKASCADGSPAQPEPERGAPRGLANVSPPARTLQLPGGKGRSGDPCGQRKCQASRSSRAPSLRVQVSSSLCCASSGELRITSSNPSLRCRTNPEGPTLSCSAPFLPHPHPWHSVSRRTENAPDADITSGLSPPFLRWSWWYRSPIFRTRRRFAKDATNLPTPDPFDYTKFRRIDGFT